MKPVERMKLGIGHTMKIEQLAKFTEYPLAEHRVGNEHGKFGT